MSAKNSLYHHENTTESDYLVNSGDYEFSIDE